MSKTIEKLRAKVKALKAENTELRKQVRGKRTAYNRLDRFIDEHCIVEPGAPMRP
jgi:hypothetical protein